MIVSLGLEQKHVGVIKSLLMDLFFSRLFINAHK